VLQGSEKWYGLFEHERHRTGIRAQRDSDGLHDA